MRPKSRATVVVVFAATALVSSTPTETSVMAASVTSGSISGMAHTGVFLPTPKPPLTTIFTAVGGDGWLERPNTVPDPLDDVDRKFRAVLGACQPAGQQVGDEHPGHAERDPEPDGDLGDRARPLAQLHDAAQ